MDEPFNLLLAPYRQGALLTAFAWLTDMGTGYTAVAVVAAVSAVLWAVGRGGVAGPLWLTLAGAEATTWALKFLVGRDRPAFLDGVEASSPSFPSAHATVALAVYGFITLLAAAAAGRRRNAVLAAGGLVVLLIGFSRIFLSLHYLTDVLAGYAVAAAWLTLGWRLARPHWRV